MENEPWVLLDRDDLTSTHGTIQAQAPRIEADKYGLTKIEIALSHATENGSMLYNNIFEREHNDLYRPDLIQLFDQEEEVGAGGSLQLRWVTPDSAVVNFLTEEGPGADLICIPQTKYARLMDQVAAQRQHQFMAAVDSMLAQGGLLRLGAFRSYGCGEECHATFLEVTNGQPVERSYICNNNRFGNVQLSSGDLLGTGDFTNRALVGSQFLYVTNRTLLEGELVHVITNLTTFTPEQMTPAIRSKLDLTAQFDEVEMDGGTSAPSGSFSKEPYSTSYTAAPGRIEEQVYTIVEEMPSFPGGEAELFKYLNRSIRYPQLAQDAGITGITYITMIVGTDGRIRDAKVLRGIGGGCDEEALRVVRSMPAWNPGRQRGKPVSVQYNLPIRFTLR